MAPKTDPYTWTKDEQRELVRILGSADPELLASLAWIVWSERPWAAAMAFASTPDGRAELIRTDEDKRRLRAAALPLDRAIHPLLGLTPFMHAAIAQTLGTGWLERLTATRDLLWAFRVSKRPRHRPKGWARLLAERVADLLATHKIRLTVGEHGRFARLLAFVCMVVDPDRTVLDPDIGGLVRAIVKARRTR